MNTTKSEGKFIVVETECYEYLPENVGKPLEDRTGRKVYIIYMHLNSILVEPSNDDDENGILEKGTLIALSGNTGGSVIAHLHYGIFLADAGYRSFSNNVPWDWNRDWTTTIDPMLFYNSVVVENN